MEWNVQWLQEYGFTDHQGKWLYCLLTCLEKPLTPELCDNVRQMVFLCARDRARLVRSSQRLGATGEVLTEIGRDWCGPHRDRATDEVPMVRSNVKTQETIRTPFSLF